MAAGVPHLRGLQQHHEKEQGPLRHDRGGGDEEKEGEEGKLTNRETVHIPGSGYAPSFYPAIRYFHDLFSSGFDEHITFQCI